MGLGIWSMHYIGMLAFSLPVPVRIRLADRSGIAAGGDRCIGRSALRGEPRRAWDWASAAAGSVFMGAGIATMHYVGMAAMRVDGHVPLQSRSW